VLGADLVMAERPRLTLGTDHNLTGVRREFLEHAGSVLPGLGWRISAQGVLEGRSGSEAIAEHWRSPSALHQD
jgi:hypothetical protein